MLPAVTTLRALGAGILLATIGLLFWQNHSLRGALVAAETELQVTVDRHNAAVRALQADSERRQDAVRRAIEAAPMPRPRVAEALRDAPRGDTAAERFEDIDRRFLEALR